MYNSNWEEKYNRGAQKEMTYTEAYDMMEWRHNILEDMRINADRRRKHRRPFKMSLTDVARIVDAWQGRTYDERSVYQMNHTEKYKIDIVNFMGWREQHFSDNLEALKRRAKREIESKLQPKDLMIYRKAPGYDNWSVMFSYHFHEPEYLDTLTDDKEERI